MKLSTSLLAAAALFFGIVTGASAQATRTWVSGVGDDANPCSRTAPCKTFAGAISKTAAGGEINVLDPGGFGAVTITKAITIKSVGFEAGVLVSGTNAIIISSTTPSNAEVILEGLDIEGLGTGIHGVSIFGGASVVIRNCSIRHFSQLGINMQSNVATRLLLEDSVVSSNLGGMLVAGAGGASNTAVVHRSTIDTHPAYGINVDGPSTVVLSGSFLTGGATGNRLQYANGGQVISSGNNVIDGPSLPPTSTSPLR